MLHARPKNFFSHAYRVFHGEKLVARVDVSHFSRRGALAVGNRELVLRKQGVLHPEYLMLLNEEAVAQARKESFLCDRVQLLLGGADCELRRKGLFGSCYLVWLGDEQIGEIRRTNLFSRRAVIDLPEEWPLELRLFVFWIVVLFWRRDTASSSGG